jgi:antitoxin component YwqK of YwqJK toxin-antitoxin module
MLTTLFLLACSGSETPAEDPAALLPPAEITCPEGTVLQTAASAKGEETWCDRGGVMHGPYLQHYPDGSKATKGTYDSNVPDSDWIYWHPNGQESSKGKYARGKQTGSWTWWHANGNRQEEGDYLAGRKAGQWTTWYEDGKKKEEGIYHNGMKNGAWTYFNDDEENTIQKVERWELGEMKESREVKPVPKPKDKDKAKTP